MNYFYFLPLLLAGTMQAQTHQDSLVMDEMVIQSNRLQIPVSEQNRNISVITAEQIRNLPAKSVNEILSYVSGVDVRQRGPFGTQTDVSLDGGSFEQTIILLNGIKVSDHQTAHNSLNIPVPVEAIDRIEILRGPAARIYGVNSLTGAINIVTKTPEQHQVFAHVFGGSNFKKDEENNGELYNGRGVQAGGAFVGSKHYQQVYASHESGTGYRYNTAYHNNRLLYQGQIRPNDFNRIDVMAGWVRSSFGANGFYAAPGDVEAKEVVSTTLVALKSHHRLSENFVLSPQVGYRYNYDDYRYFRHDLSRARSQHYTNAVTGEVSGTYTTAFGAFGFGTEARYEQINSSNIGNHERENYGFYAEFRTKDIKNTDITLGTYVNYNSVFGWQVFPGLDVSYAVLPALKIVFNTGTSQRIPSFTDLYLNQRPGNIGNPDLTDEQAFQVEGGVKFKEGRWEAKAIAFYRIIEDFIDWTRTAADVPWQANNVGRLKTTGLNTGLMYNVLNWKVGVQYTYLSPEMNNDPNQLSKYKIENFRHQLVNTIAFQQNHFTALLANRYHNRISYTDYLITDIRVSYQQKAFTYYIDAQNIFDKTYIEAGAVPMPGRWFSVGIRFNSFL